MVLNYILVGCPWLVWVCRNICQHYKRSRLRYFIFKVVTLIKPEMYNILIATSQDTSLFLPLGCFLLPVPTASLRPVADSGLVKSSNLSFTWHSRGSLRCRDSESKEKVKKATGRIFDRLKIRTFTQNSLKCGVTRDDSQQWFLAQAVTRRCNIVAILFRMVATFFQHCNAVLRRIVQYNITLTVRKFRRIAVQSSMWTTK